MGRKDAVALTVLVLAALALALGSLARRPDIYNSGAVLIGDPSYNLLVADRLLDGASLHDDIATPYGPVPAYLHAAAAALFGNTVSTFHLVFVALSAINIGLAYLLLRRVAGPWTALLLAALGLFPTLLIPGSLVGGFQSSPYIPLERTLLLTAALCWAPPATRSPGRAVAMGVAFGVWQGVRFGGGIFAGVAVVVVDALAIWRGGGSFRRWIGSLLLTLAGFLVMQGGWALWAFATLPPDLARDALWPVFVLETYAAWVTPSERWPMWGGVGMFLGQQLTLVAGAIAGVVMSAVVASSRRAAVGRGDGGLALLIPFVFFLLGSVVFFRQAYHFYQFGWALVFPLAWLASRGRVWSVGVAAILLPCFALDLKAQLLSPRDPTLEPLALPNGETVWLAPELRRSVLALDAVLDRAGPAAGGVVFVPMAAGLQHFYDLPTPLRQPWILRGFVRPYDEAELVRDVAGARAVVVLATVGVSLHSDPCRWFTTVSNPFRGPICETIAPLLERPVPAGSHFLVFPVKRARGALDARAGTG